MKFLCFFFIPLCGLIERIKGFQATFQNRKIKNPCCTNRLSAIINKTKCTKMHETGIHVHAPNSEMSKPGLLPGAHALIIRAIDS